VLDLHHRMAQVGEEPPEKTPRVGVGVGDQDLQPPPEVGTPLGAGSILEEDSLPDGGKTVYYPDDILTMSWFREAAERR
jgi:hypothetical protein